MSDIEKLFVGFPPPPTGFAHDARNKVCADGHLNMALDSIMGSNSPDGKFCVLGELAGKAIDIALELASVERDAMAARIVALEKDAIDAKCFRYVSKHCHLTTMAGYGGPIINHRIDIPADIETQDVRAAVLLEIQNTECRGADLSDDEFYLQDSRSYVGNDVRWWAKNGGYVTDVRLAKVYAKADAIAQHQQRETDIPWPKHYIDGKTRPAVDMQYIKRDEALAGTGIEIRKPQRNRYDLHNCVGCGRFINDLDRYTSRCRHCGADNKP